jgi:cytoskeletal protein RodZ
VRFIGLDPQTVLTEYNTFLDDKSRLRPAKDQGHQGYAFERKDGERSRTYLWVVMVVFTLIGGGIIFVLKPALKHKRVVHLEELKKTATPQPTQSPSTHTETPIAAASTPSPTPVPTPSPSMTIALSEDELDPLLKGDDLKPGEFRQKLVLKVLSDVTIRYQVDDRKVMRISLQKDKVIVMKAKKLIRFQVSNIKAVEYRYKTSEFHPLEALSGLRVTNGVGAMIVPPEELEKTKEIFEKEGSLPHTPDPT